jgi:hypothetical protein
VLVRLELYPNKDGPDFHFLGHELCLRSLRPKPITAYPPNHQMEPGMLPAPPELIRNNPLAQAKTVFGGLPPLAFSSGTAATYLAKLLLTESKHVHV